MYSNAHTQNPHILEFDNEFSIYTLYENTILIPEVQNSLNPHIERLTKAYHQRAQNPEQ
jgi:hypothetical protein